MVSRVDAYIQTHQIVHVRRAGVFVYQLHLNEAVKKDYTFIPFYLQQTYTTLVIKNTSVREKRASILQTSSDQPLTPKLMSISLDINLDVLS